MNLLPAASCESVRTRAHIVPFAVFLGFMLLLQLVGALITWDHPDAPWWRKDPAFWLYPIQTLVTGGILIHYWKSYEFQCSWKWSFAAILFGLVGIGLWLLPTALHDFLPPDKVSPSLRSFFGIEPRTDGFDPSFFTNPTAYWTTIVLRFLRAVVIVALIEEIFWRGFLMRFVADIDGDYWRQPFGRATWLTYLVPTILFTFVHSAADRPAAFIYGSLTWLLCIWSKNLVACIVMHATANLAMGIYIMSYGKYGLW